MLSSLPEQYSAYISALALGLLIGTVRERQSNAGDKAAAGMRTHTLAALAGAVAWSLGPVAFAITLGAMALLAFAGYRLNASSSPGLTGEVALVLTTLLGGLAQTEPGLATALAVLVALLLQLRESLHRFSRDLISEAEVRDGLMLLAAVLLILPLLPDRDVGPFDALNPSKLWQLVVLVMAISALGHIALRVVGSRFGLPLAGFFAGFVSSTAAIAGFGQRVSASPALLGPCVAAAQSAALASLILTIPVLATVSSSFLFVVLPQLLAFGGVLLVAVVLGVRRSEEDSDSVMPTSDSRMFSLQHALLFAALIAGVLLLSAFLKQHFGNAGALVTAAIAALIELHAAMVSVAQLGSSGSLEGHWAAWAVQVVLLSSVLARGAVAFTAGGRAYGLHVGAVLMIAWLLSCVAVYL